VLYSEIRQNLADFLAEAWENRR